VCIERRVIESTEPVNKTQIQTLEMEDDDFSASMNLHSAQAHNQMGFSLQSTHCTEADTSYTCVTKYVNINLRL